MKRAAITLLAVLPAFAADNQPVSARELRVVPKALDLYADAQNRLTKHDSDGARKKLEQAVALAPDYAAAWNALGVISQQPETYFRRAVAVDPDNAEGLLNLGGYLLKTGRAEEAFSYNDRAASVLANDAAAQAQLGMNLYQLGRLDRAEQTFVKAKRLDARCPSMPQLFLAEIYARRGEKGRAVAEIEELLVAQPDPGLAEILRATLARLK